MTPAEPVPPNVRSSQEPELPRYRFVVYGLTWLAYATYYLGRKGLSVSKSTIEAAQVTTESQFAWIESGYLAAYALGQFGNGLLCDKIGARKLISGGLLLSALACIAFGQARWAGMMIIAFFINGYAQSTGWPGTNKAMAAWTTTTSRGGIMGLWATCYQFGGIAATAFATWLLTHFGWRWTFFGPAMAIIVMALLIFTLLRDTPHSQPKRSSLSQQQPGTISQEERAQRKEERRKVLKSLHVWCYGASYFSIKLIRYSILFWLPYYLHHALHYSTKTAGYLSVSFEVGGILGTIGFGFVSDRFPKYSRALYSMIGLSALAVALLIYQRIAGWGMAFNFVSMGLVGACLFGPDSLLSGAAAQDLGGKYAVGVAVGIINGLGSLGAILEGVAIVFVRKQFGWQGVFYMFIIFAVFSVVCLAPTVLFRKPQPTAA
jgi:MFS transporter, OPA family, sugar phosphate sensor protein UhpC